MEEHKKKLCYLVILIFIGSLIPLFIIANYNHSCADDYSYGLMAYEEWNRSHSFVSTIMRALERVKKTYFEWQGTYAAIFLMALQPAVWGEQFYFLSTYIMLGLLISSTYYLGKIVFIDYLQADKYTYLIITTVILMVSIQLVPTPVQAFYWYNGSIFYVCFHSAMLILIALFLKLLRHKNGARPIGMIVAASLAGLFVGGGNYLTALLTVEIEVVFIIIFSIYNRKKLYCIIIPFIANFSGFIISMAAPGNAVRQANFLDTKMGVIETLRHCFIEGFAWFNNWTTVYIVLALFFLIPFIWDCVSKSTYKWRYPLLVITLSYCLFASTYAPTFFATGGAGGGRVHNIRFFFFVLLLVLNITWILGWLSNIVKVRRQANHKNIILYYSFIVAVLLFASLHLQTWNKFTTLSALRSLKNHEAQTYDKEMNKRLEHLLSEEKNVSLDKLSVKPYVLYFDDIQPDENDWRNTSVARWFKKERVGLKE